MDCNQAPLPVGSVVAGSAVAKVQSETLSTEERAQARSQLFTGSACQVKLGMDTHRKPATWLLQLMWQGTQMCQITELKAQCLPGRLDGAIKLMNKLAQEVDGSSAASVEVKKNSRDRFAELIEMFKSPDIQ